jgi:hypothetical protein
MIHIIMIEIETKETIEIPIDNSNKETMIDLEVILMEKKNLKFL